MASGANDSPELGATGSSDPHDSNNRSPGDRGDERPFSAGGHVIDTYRASLDPETVQALICGGDWIRKLHGVKKKNKLIRAQTRANSRANRSRAHKRAIRVQTVTKRKETARDIFGRCLGDMRLTFASVYNYTLNDGFVQQPLCWDDMVEL
ncbi:hypothetical protein CTI12_AA093260 [Artemisia annua]|uniref:HAT C-terminal dimerisation domain-containing protein n=1 Tax=Artemisia annua TaxID=35608 RepID=A0A2U1PZF1_ARTAN|nr:hypothetical protein CTI12_AA093260 [Artemisia annua]